MGAIVELVDLQEWAQPLAKWRPPVPTARPLPNPQPGYSVRRTPYPGMTPNGEIKISATGVQLFSFFRCPLAIFRRGL